MSTMTLKQVRDWHAKESREYFDLDQHNSAARHAAMADAIDAILRERESAKVTVTDETVEAACKVAAMEADTAVFPDAYSDEEADDLRKTMRAALEAIAPHLASARVPDGWSITSEKNPLGGPRAMRLHAPDGRTALFGSFSEERLTRDFLALLADAPKPETE